MERDLPQTQQYVKPFLTKQTNRVFESPSLSLCLFCSTTCRPSSNLALFLDIRSTPQQLRIRFACHSP
eukprot:scaffold2425_cov76-Skeletonema_dohrnii-CCMP3373.AAC.17